MADAEKVWPDVIRVELRFEPASLTQAERARLMKAFLKKCVRFDKRAKLRHDGWADTGGNPLPPVVWSVKEDGPPPPVVKHKRKGPPPIPSGSRRPCRFPGCDATLTGTLVFCGPHYQRLDQAGRDEVTRIRSARRQNKIDDDEHERRLAAVVARVAGRVK
jgi:hypothetical protein